MSVGLVGVSKTDSQGFRSKSGPFAENDLIKTSKGRAKKQGPSHVN